VDLVDELMLEHARIARMLDHVEDVPDDERADAIRALVAELVAHESAEETVVYPALERCAAGGSSIAAERLAEQHEAEDMLADVEHALREGTVEDGLLSRLRAAVIDHARAEEATVFWLLRTNLSEADSRRLAARYDRVKARAPTHPHPWAPGGRLRSLVFAPAAARVDRWRDGHRADSDPASGPAHWDPPVDAVAVLKADHETLRLLADQFERQGEAAPRAVLERLAQEVARHGVAEIERLYPLVARMGPDAQNLVKKARLDHEEIALRITTLTSVPLGTHDFREEAATLVRELREHLAVEEGEIFPLLGSQTSAAELQTLGEKLQRARRRAPRSPHPHAPKSALGSRMADRLLHAAEVVERVAGRR